MGLAGNHALSLWKLVGEILRGIKGLGEGVLKSRGQHEGSKNAQPLVKERPDPRSLSGGWKQFTTKTTEDYLTLFVFRDRRSVILQPTRRHWNVLKWTLL